MKTASRVFSLFGSSLLSMAAAAAGPTITELSFVQNPESRVAAVSFTLGAESIVTLDVQTNGVSIGWRNYRAGIAGCAFGKINPAGAYRLEWKPWETWTDAPRSLPSNSVKAVITAWSPDNTPDYMDIDLTSASNITYYVSEEDLPYAVTNDIYKTKHLLMKRIHCANRQWTKG